MEAFSPYLVPPGKKISLKDYDTSTDKSKPDKETINEKLDEDIKGIAELQNRLYIENNQSLLIILQGMDGSGKDSTVKHVMSGVNPQGVFVYSFKKPSEEELDHDYLWRHYQKLPRKGETTIFNRSYYENVLISKVHPEILLAGKIHGIDSVGKIGEDFWNMRYDQINQFEKTLVQNGTTIVKFFLHLSKKEQKKRFLKRLEEREKNWKFSYADIQERAFWKDYQECYEDAISHTSTEWAPWYIIPADNKWFTHLLVGRIILQVLKIMDPALPQLSKEEEELLKKAKMELENEER
jgi:PPK2 family polyphosphate:nucleotide phosphotransferase